MIEIFFLIFILVGLAISTMRKPKNYPPGPVALPVIGNYLLLNMDNPQKTFDLFHARFGEIVGMIFPKFKVVLLNGYEACKEAFANEDCLGRPDACLIRDRFEGENYGVLFTDGDGWKSQRRFTLHHFRNLGFGRKDHEAAMLDEAEALTEMIMTMEGKPFILEKLLTMSSINITWALIGSKRFAFSDPRLEELADNINKSIHSVKCTGSAATVFPFLRHLFPDTTGYTSVTTGSKGAKEFVKIAIKEHAATRVADNARDFIDIYLQELETNVGKEPSFSEKQLEGICLDLLCAGGDTSSAVIGYAILFLCLDQKLQEKVYCEIKEYVGEDKIPTMEDKINLVHTEATLAEVLRYRTPAPTVVPHRATKDTTLLGYQIPKDTILFINLKSIFMEQSYWKDPDQFRPDRFISEDGKFVKDERLIAFGKGKRSCLGETLAKMTTFIILSTLIQRFSFSLPTNMPVPDTEGVPGFTMAPPSYMVIATPRTKI